jgi:lipopolysaccharide biosynthesis glycosyltransferase
VDAAVSIVLASDRRFVRQLSVTLASIAVNTGERPHRVFILHDGFASQLIRKLERPLEGLDLCWLDARSAAIQGVRLPDYLTRGSLFRLRIDELLPDEVDRVLYLDADLLVREPLVELWETPLDGRLLGAVRDATSPWVSAVFGFPWREFGMSPSAPYFNAGVMVIPLDDWRSQRVGPRSLELLQRHGFANADQCALNVVVGSAWKALEPRWNMQWGHLVDDGTLAWVSESEIMERLAPREAAIIHFNSGRMRRPWEPHCTHPYCEEWIAMLEHTAWPGWHPKRNGRVKRAGQRLRRAGRMLAHDR